MNEKEDGEWGRTPAHNFEVIGRAGCALFLIISYLRKRFRPILCQVRHWSGRYLNLIDNQLIIDSLPPNVFKTLR